MKTCNGKAVLLVTFPILLSSSLALAGDPMARAKATFDRVSQEIDADEERGGLPEDSLDTILWKLQSVPQLKAHAIASVKQYKMMRNAYQVYALSVEMVARLNESDWPGAEWRETYNGMLDTYRKEWERTSEIIRQYNDGVAEQYRIKVLDWPFPRK